MKVGEALYKAQQAQQAGAGEGSGPSSAGTGAGGANDKVVDADFEEVDDQKKRGSG
jgi:molecular chaperone DnaK